MPYSPTGLKPVYWYSLTHSVEISRDPNAVRPLNLDYSFQTRTVHKSLLQGPAVYLIAFEDTVIYIGSYKPYDRGQIFRDRWLRHLETMTLRGRRVGFGRLERKAILELITRQDMRLQMAALLDLPDQAQHRLGDTGCVTNPWRIRFANANWPRFRAPMPLSSILEPFELRLFQLQITGSQPALYAAYEVTTLEKHLIAEYHPRCNAGSPPGNIIPVQDVVIAIDAYCLRHGSRVSVKTQVVFSDNQPLAATPRAQALGLSLLCAPLRSPSLVKCAAQMQSIGFRWTRTQLRSMDGWSPTRPTLIQPNVQTQ